MAYLFDKGDQEYFDWMNRNPDGFILNTGKGKKNSFFILHKSNCFHITKSKLYDDRAYTMKDWVKVASNNVEKIVDFCRKNRERFNGEFDLCKTCKPEYFESEIIYPDEMQSDQKHFKEGAMKEVMVNSFERNPNARKACIEHFGCICKCCGINFKETYGDIGEGFIHVHHLKLISEIGNEYKVDPKKDLIPLCPNCHAMVHKRNPPLKIDELKEIMVKKR